MTAFVLISARMNKHLRYEMQLNKIYKICWSKTWYKLKLFLETKISAGFQWTWICILGNKLKYAFCSIPLPTFSQADHLLVLLLLACWDWRGGTIEKRSATVVWEGQGSTSEQSELVDWNILKTFTSIPNEYISVVTSFIKKSVDNHVPTKTTAVYPNQKPWVNREINSLLKSLSETFKEDDSTLYEAEYNLHKAINGVKRDVQNKLTAQFTVSDARQLRQDKSTIMSYDWGWSLAKLDEINAFTPILNSRYLGPSSPAPIPHWRCPIHIGGKSQIHLHEGKLSASAGPERVPGWILNPCANQLAASVMFNLSLQQSTVLSDSRKPLSRKVKWAVSITTAQ